MFLQHERELVANYGRKLIKDCLTVGTSGNISIYNREEDLIAISPSGMDYFEIKPEDVVIIDRSGKVIEGNRKPSSEKDMHRLLYTYRKDVNAAVHTHSKFATLLACLNWSIEPIHPILACAGGNVRCTPYMISHNDAFGETVIKYIANRYAVLLGNHGALTCGPNIRYAYTTAISVEFCSELYYRARAVAEPRLLSETDMSDMMHRFQSIRQRQ